jgi:hypothetical protein
VALLFATGARWGAAHVHESVPVGYFSGRWVGLAGPIFGKALLGEHAFTRVFSEEDRFFEDIWFGVNLNIRAEP